MSRETILSFDPSVSPGKYTIVPVINAAAVMLTSWSTCVTFQLWKSQAIPSPQFIIGFLPASTPSQPLYWVVHYAGGVGALRHARKHGGNLHDGLLFISFTALFVACWCNI